MIVLEGFGPFLTPQKAPVEAKTPLATKMIMNEKNLKIFFLLFLMVFDEK